MSSLGCYVGAALTSEVPTLMKSLINQSGAIILWKTDTFVLFFFCILLYFEIFQAVKTKASVRQRRR